MIIPPSHNMIIFALAAGGLSTGKMFLCSYSAANGFVDHVLFEDSGINYRSITFDFQ